MKKKISLALIVILVAIQFIPVKKNETTGDSSMDFLVQNLVLEENPVHEILKTSCYDCHSNSTAYPWYNKVAPISWYLGKHIRNAKSKLNFSEWGTYDADKKAHKTVEIIDYVEKDWMPIVTYKIMHADAKLSEEEKSLILSYFRNL